MAVHKTGWIVWVQMKKYWFRSPNRAIDFYWLKHEQNLNPSWPVAVENENIDAHREEKRNPSKRKTVKRVSAALKKWMAQQKKNPGRRNGGGASTASRTATATRTATEATTTGNKTSTSTGGASTSGGNVSISVKHNPSKGVTLRNMSSVTIERLPGGAVRVTGRKMAGKPKKR